jgi:hypothetical protein
MTMKRTKPAQKARKPRPRRRPRLYETPEWPAMRQKAIDYAGLGQYLEECCEAAGFSSSLWHKYQALAIEILIAAKRKAEAKKHDEYHRYIPRKEREMVDFVETMWRAKATAKTLAAAEFRKKDPGEYLARIDHERWGRKDRMTLTGDPENPLNTGVVVILPDNGRGPPKTGEAPPTEVKPEDKK